MDAYVQANTNGRLHPADEPSISPLNRGFLYGDAIYEVWRTYGDVIFVWEEHWARLYRSAEALYFNLQVGPAQILPEIRRTVAAFREKTNSKGEVYIRLQVTRGSGAIGLDPALAETTLFIILVQENRLYAPEKFAAGLALSMARHLHRNSPDTLNPAWKTGNYLNNILCLREARTRGADEVVICNQHGALTEAAVSNIAFVKDGVLITPRAEDGILEGITRQVLLEKVIPGLDVQVETRTIFPDELSRLDECFILSTTKDLTPVSKIDDYGFKIGPDTLTFRLKREFGKYVDTYIRLHPELSISG